MALRLLLMSLVLPAVYFSAVSGSDCSQGSQDAVGLLQQELHVTSRGAISQTAAFDTHVSQSKHSDATAGSKSSSTISGAAAAASTAGSAHTGLDRHSNVAGDVAKSWIAQPFTTTTAKPIESNPSGVNVNAAGDINSLLTSMVMNVVLPCVYIVAFSILRKTYPIMFSHNVLLGITPSLPDVNRMWSWARPVLMASTREIMLSVGLDAAMLSEFLALMVKISATVGLPMFFVSGGMNWAFGGLAAGDDYLSYLSYGNVTFGNWLYSFAPIVIWLTTLTVVRLVWQAQRKFIILRMEWLKSMPKVRANTVLVTEIPAEYQSDARLKEYFEVLFPGKVKSAYCTKDTSKLTPLHNSLKNAKLKQLEAQKLTELDPAHPPSIRPTCCGHSVNAEAYWADQVATLEPQVQAERDAVKCGADEIGWKGGHCQTGFVTFKEREYAEVAGQLRCLDFDTTTWQVNVPPEPTDIAWNDLTQDPRAEAGRHVTGYLLTFALFMAYIPIILAISRLAKTINMGPFQPLWAAFAPTLGLLIMVSFLPTFLRIIFANCFTLNAAQWMQHKLQTWYFWFMIAFVVLAPVIGQNTPKFVATLFTKPIHIFFLFAETMPSTTHFYITYLVLLWNTHSLVITRFVMLGKFLAARKIFDDEYAKKVAEPEDQDYFGQGSRNARFMICLTIPLVYGTCSPPVWIASLVNSCILWGFHTYLLVFAETKKPDLGGVFFVTNMRLIYVSLFLYLFLMAGVLYLRASTLAPAVVVALAFPYLLWSKQKFEALAWECIPYYDVMLKGDKAFADGYTEVSPTLEYMQTELLD